MLKKETSMSIRMDCFGMTDIGKKRACNEDQFLIADLSKSLRLYQTSLALDDQTRLFGGTQGHLLMVADGMGGRAAGERASTIVIDSMVSYILDTLPWFFRLVHDNEEEFQDELKAALLHCQQRIELEAEAFPDRKGMGTTLTMAYLIWPRMYVVHVGDSRCYLFRDGKLKQVTRDHTVAEAYVEQGELDPVDADGSRWSHVLWNFVGGNSDELTPDVHKVELRFGDTVLLCTDGLTKCLADVEITERLRSNDPAQVVCQNLVSGANEKGSPDNTTVIVTRLVSGDNSLETEELELQREQPKRIELSKSTRPAHRSRDKAATPRAGKARPLATHRSLRTTDPVQPVEAHGN
jgi:protein phosphatase